MSIPILEYVDVLIGLAIVMMIIATVALSLSQALLKMFDARARYLSLGLHRVLQQLDSTAFPAQAKTLADLVLKHPSVCQVRSPVSRLLITIAARIPVLRKWLPAVMSLRGEVVLREELAVCLLEIASGDVTWEDSGSGDDDEDKAAAAVIALRQALAEGGIADPLATLDAYRLQAMQNEQAHPEQSAAQWRSQALAQVAPTPFMATLFQSFDTAMARATASFGSEAQIWVTLTALVIVIVLQLDTFTLVRRLSADDAYRAALVAEAQRLDTEAGSSAAPVFPDANGTCTQSDQLQRQRCEVNAALQVLHTPALDIWPTSPSAPVDAAPTHAREWLTFQYTRATTLLYSAVTTPGILVTWLLVSLGAPFWYDLLKNLFQLRSLLAQRDQKDRTERASATGAQN
ncbi:MAG: hypothetical protein QM736_05245 [Vicinamibacterales bacterium]